MVRIVSDRFFELPQVIRPLVEARNQLRAHFGSAGLKFTLDGNLVGDIGEAIASELFGITLSPSNDTGIDGWAPDGRTVQVKATGVRGGPAFRLVDRRADHLLFLSFDFENLRGEVIYNGPEHLVMADFPAYWEGQRKIAFGKISKLNQQVSLSDRLALLDGK